LNSAKSKATTTSQPAVRETRFVEITNVYERPSGNNTIIIRSPRNVFPYLFVRRRAFRANSYGRELYVPVVKVRVQTGDGRTRLKLFPERYYDDRIDHEADGQKTEPHEPVRQKHTHTYISRKL